MADKSITLEVFRYLPEQEDKPRFQSYTVPYREDWVVLDALNYIKDHLDATVTHRWSCRMGVCGSCGMMVNGVAKLTCAAFLKDYVPGTIRVEPLSHFPVIRDLVTDLTSFEKKLSSVKPYIVREQHKPVSEGEYLQSDEELYRYKGYSMCINCMLCYAACPVAGVEEDFVGPAALALGMRYNLDTRDQGKEARKDVMTSHSGIWDCTYVGECSVVCPKHVDPAGAIQRYKLTASMDWLKSFVMPSAANKAKAEGGTP